MNPTVDCKFYSLVSSSIVNLNGLYPTPFPTPIRGNMNDYIFKKDADLKYFRIKAHIKKKNMY